jgi:uncharacterized protein YaaR (DUF327 family)
MLNKDQLFMVDEFIKKNAHKNVWYVSDELFRLATELIKASQAKIEIAQQIESSTVTQSCS